jgi:hypothetical protein
MPADAPLAVLASANRAVDANRRIEPAHQHVKRIRFAVDGDARGRLPRAVRDSARVCLSLRGFLYGEAYSGVGDDIDAG